MLHKKWLLMMQHDKQERYYAYILRRSREENEKQEFKEACRLFWMVKGHLDTSDATILGSAESYFKRLWRMGCDGAPIADYMNGFEEAYQKRIKYGHK